jgi:CysZ protein
MGGCRCAADCEYAEPVTENTTLRAAVSRAAGSGAVRGFVSGVALLGRGFGMWATSPRLMILGAIPALLVSAFYLAAIVLLLVNLEGISGWLAPFADEWNEPWRTAAHVTVGVAILGIAILVLVYTFVAITLAVGDPFYEKIWRHVENRLGEAPAESEEPFWRSAGRGVGNALRMLLLTAFVGLALFALGFIPILGQTIVPVLGVGFGGWFLAIELAGFAFDARGFSLRDRRRMLRARRAPALGFGMTTYLLFLVPFAAIIVMPAAVAGATLLSRGALEKRGALETSVPPQGSSS